MLHTTGKQSQVKYIFKYRSTRNSSNTYKCTSVQVQVVFQYIVRLEELSTIYFPNRLVSPICGHNIQHSLCATNIYSLTVCQEAHTNLQLLLLCAKMIQRTLDYIICPQGPCIHFCANSGLPDYNTVEKYQIQSTFNTPINFVKYDRQ